MRSHADASRPILDYGSPQTRQAGGHRLAAEPAGITRARLTRRRGMSLARAPHLCTEFAPDGAIASVVNTPPNRAIRLATEEGWSPPEAMTVLLGRSASNF